MKSRPRWLIAVQKDAAACRHLLPWERGPRRAAAIARRKAMAAPAARPDAPLRARATARV